MVSAFVKLYITYQNLDHSHIELSDFVEVIKESDEITPFVLLVNCQGTQKLVSVTIEDEIDMDMIEEYAMNYEVDVTLITRDEYRNLIVVCHTDDLGFHKISGYVQKFFEAGNDEDVLDKRTVKKDAKEKKIEIEF